MMVITGTRIRIVDPLKEKGYKLFIVCSKENATDKQINEDIEATIKEVITYIENSFQGSFFISLNIEFGIFSLFIELDG